MKRLGHWFGLLLVVVIAIALYYCLLNLSHFAGAVAYLVKLLMPVIYGLVIAYLLNPLMIFYNKGCWQIYKRITSSERDREEARARAGSEEPETVRHEEKTIAAEPETVRQEIKTIAAELETARQEEKTIAAEPETARQEEKTIAAEPETARQEEKTIAAEPETVRHEIKTIAAEPETVRQEKKTIETQREQMPDERRDLRLQSIFKGISITLAMITGFLIIIVLLWMVVPQVANSIINMVNTLPAQVQDYYHRVQKWVTDNPYMANQFQDALLHVTGSLEQWIQQDLFPWLQTGLLPNVNSVAATVASGLFNVLGVLYNLFIGCIVAVYLLLGKEKFLAEAKKMVYAVFGKKQADVILHYCRLTNDTFSGFIVGKIIDSAIIGVLCFLVMWLIKLPYPLLVSVIVGVTNVIPVFGPYMGAIPSAFLILLVDPLQCVYFVIFIIVLQQLDGNVIGPTILGESTGLSAFWVLFSILLFGGMWGLAGMIVGVPLFAMLYRLLKDFLELRLYRKKFSTETEQYRDLKFIWVDDEGNPQYQLFSRQEKENARIRRAWENKVHLQDLLQQRAMRSDGQSMQEEKDNSDTVRNR